MNLIFMGTTCGKILNVFILCIALSTFIRTLAIFRDFRVAFFVKLAPFVKAGMFNGAFLGGNK